MRNAVTIAAFAAITTLASADVATPSASQLAIAAGGSVSFGDRVQTGGSVASGTTVSVGHDNIVNGSVYAGAGFSMNDRATIGGNLYANTSVSTGSQGTVTGSINAGSTVYLGHRGNYSSVNAGTSFSSSHENTINGSVSAGTSVWVGMRTAVSGSVDYGTTYGADSSASVSGTIGTNPTTPSSWSMPSMPLASPSHSGGSSVWVGHGQSSVITTGSYGSFSTGANTTLSFSSGTYSFDSFYAGHDANLVFDTSAGDVVIYSNADFNTGDRISFDTTSDNGRVIVYAANGVWIGHDAVIDDAALTAISGSLSLGDRVSMTGTLQAGADIWVGHDSTLAPSSIPAPSALGVLGLAGIAASRRRRG